MRDHRRVTFFFFVSLNKKKKMAKTEIVAVILAYVVLIAAGVGGYALSLLRVNIRRLHNSFAVILMLIVGLGLIKHTKKLLLNGHDVLAWGHFIGFALFIMLVVWILMAHNRQKKKKKKKLQSSISSRTHNTAPQSASGLNPPETIPGQIEP